MAHVRSEKAMARAANEAPMAMPMEAANSAGSYSMAGEVCMAAMPV